MQSANIRVHGLGPGEPGPGTAASVAVKGSGKGFGERKSRKHAAGRAFPVILLSASQCPGCWHFPGAVCSNDLPILHFCRTAYPCFGNDNSFGWLTGDSLDLEELSNAVCSLAADLEQLYRCQT